jgi:hypothetical protein
VELLVSQEVRLRLFVVDGAFVSGTEASAEFGK